MHTIKIMTILLITKFIYDTLKWHTKFKKSNSRTFHSYLTNYRQLAVKSLSVNLDDLITNTGMTYEWQSEHFCNGTEAIILPTR